MLKPVKNDSTDVERTTPLGWRNPKDDSLAHQEHYLFGVLTNLESHIGRLQVLAEKVASKEELKNNVPVYEKVDINVSGGILQRNGQQLYALHKVDSEFRYLLDFIENKLTKFE